ncbi:unnamed protein product [marine sediment metagenome]|uniref:Uncharacterized protein n=1 Tax=marine sediment metagenome TaxID=412755 RepID=X1CAE5_9ZZZZ
MFNVLIDKKKSGNIIINKITFIFWNKIKKQSPKGKNNPIKKKTLNFDSISLRYCRNFFSNEFSVRVSLYVKLDISNSFK